MKKKILIAAILVGTLAAGLFLLTYNPIVSCKIDVPEDYLEAIQSQAKGVYSRALPLIPVFVSVVSYSADTVYYTIYYFPFGTVGMSYREGDGYNIEKYLIGL